MDKIINLQKEINNVISKADTNFKKSPKDRITVEYVETRLEMLEKNWQSFSDNHNKLFESIDPEKLNSSLYVQSELYDKTEDTYIMYRSNLKALLNKFTSDSRTTDSEDKSQHSLSGVSNKQSAVKLPRILIPTFSGNYSEWTSFRDLFISLVHKNESLDNVQRLHYLKGYLTGEAAQLIRHTPVTDANYTECWSLLEKRYDNKKYLSNCILQKLFSQKRMNAESASGLKVMLDTTMDCLNALKNLCIDVSTWDIIIIHIVTYKLDSETRKQWELFIASDDSLPTIEQFKQFMETRFRALDCIEPRKHFSQNHAHAQNTKALVATQASRFKCEYCSQGHKLCFCKKFSQQNVNSRREFVLSNKLCFNCLGSNHMAYDCKKMTPCKICQKRHHSLLHLKNEVNNGNNGTSANQSTDGTTSLEAEVPVVACVASGYIPRTRQVLLATAVIMANNKMGQPKLIRALVDQGAQACFVTEATVQNLRLKKIPANGIISGLSDNKTMHARYKVRIQVQSRVDTNFRMEIEAFVLSTITSCLPEQKVDVIGWLGIDDLQLADPQYNVPNKIDILLGADVYSIIMREGIKKCPRGSLMAQCTTLGWIISGSINHGNLKKEQPEMRVSVMHAQFSDNEMLKRFWEIEENTYNTRKMLTEEEEECERLYETTTKQTKEGRYVVSLPFRDEKTLCEGGNSKEIAVKRLLSLEKRLFKNKDLREKYTDVLQEYLQLGHMRPVIDGDNMSKEAVYLPHHAVVREDKSTTKVRVVFNASEPNAHGISLNDALLVGPTLQADLRHTILRWRTHPIALVADIIKMYRQVVVEEADANRYQRIVWRNDPKEEIQDYVLNTVTFGTASAPYLAVRTLHQVANDYGAEYPLAADRVLYNFYIDDLMTGCATAQEGLEIYKQMQELLRQGGFELQKWDSNNTDLIKQISAYQNKNMKSKTGEEKEIEKLENTIKILGLTWNRSKDEFKYVVKLSPTTGAETKRKIIAEIARLFDPLGWVAPSVVIAKMFIQKLWLSGVGWDDQIPHTLNEEWNTYRKEFAELSKIKIPRWFGTKTNDHLVELHGFCDASKLAYAAVVYMRITDSSNSIRTSLVAAKTRVSPIKQVSIPRLELCGAVLLTKLLAEMADVLNVTKDKVYAWTDSTIVLAWLNSHPSRWKTFVGNRVSEILTTLESTQWFHVRSPQNPADCASRGVSPAALAENDLWFSGPSFLKEQPLLYQKPKDLQTKEEEAVKVHVGEVVEDTLFIKYSSLQKLLRIVAYCRRFKKIKESTTRTKYLRKVEIDAALECCIKKVQLDEFPEEYKTLKEGKAVNNKNSKIRTLIPYLDGKGLIRVAGRLEHSKLDEQTKHPIVLPYNSPFTNLIVAEAHEKTLHGGQQLMFNYLRSAYWIVRAKSLIKHHINRCVKCARMKALIHNPFMGALPPQRCMPARAFIHSGVDYAGPINIRTTKGRGCRSHKGYICLFICMSTRAIHLEVVSDMTSQAFLAAFRRFVARRGRCIKLWSDNGTTFVGAAKELQELSSLQPEIAEHLEKNGTEWHFIPPRAPNFGGLWEAGVKSTKFHLKRVIGNSTLTYEEMNTLLAQVEACLNSRPITKINCHDPNEPVPLTPGHFLVGEPLVNVPDVNYSFSKQNSLSRWQLIQSMLQSFWQRWSNEYLVTLMHRYKWSRQIPEPKVGDIVLIKEDDLPPGQWLLGRIIQKYPGSDNVTRVVTLRTKSSILKRPISKLCVLPVDV